MNSLQRVFRGKEMRYGESRAGARLPPLKASFQPEKGKEGKDSKTSSLSKAETNHLAPCGSSARAATPPQSSYFHAAITATPCSGVGPTNDSLLLQHQPSAGLTLSLSRPLPLTHSVQSFEEYRPVGSAGLEWTGIGNLQ